MRSKGTTFHKRAVVYGIAEDGPTFLEKLTDHHDCPKSPDWCHICRGLPF